MVVPTFRRPAALRRCLEHVATLEHPSFEVIVVDNSDGDEIAHAIADAAGARYVVEPAPGASLARNAGARTARGELVAFLDDDSFPDERWLSVHAQAHEDDPGLGVTTGRIVAWPQDSAVAQAYAAVGGEDLGDCGFRVDRATPGWFESANFGGLGIGPNMVFKRRLFDAGFGFRTDLGPRNDPPGDEHYAFFTVIRTGGAIAYLPDAVVYHEAPASMKALEARKREILRSGAIYGLMLLVEEPEHRGTILRYLGDGVRRRNGGWRPGPDRSRFASRSDVLMALAHAPAGYLRWRWRHHADGNGR